MDTQLRSWQRRPGFTLVEVTLALFVFAISMTVLTQAFVNTLVSVDKVVGQVGQPPEFDFVRGQVLRVPELDTVREGGSIDTLTLGEVQWEAEVEPTSVSDLFQVVLTVSIPPEPDEPPEPITQGFMLLRPAWSDPDERSELLEDNRDRLERDRS